MNIKFRTPLDIKTEKIKKVNVSTRVNPEIRRKLELAAKKTPQKVPLATLVEEVLEDYVKFVEMKGII